MAVEVLDVSKERFCKDCKSYNRKTKKCTKKNEFVARKHNCSEFDLKK